ncbi:MAG: 4Fe-4S dicluster domain-containing protein [Desulfovibrionaceae bacterium]
MSRYSITTDEQLCISCKACEVHCKVYNKVPLGLKLGVHVQAGPQFDHGTVRMHTLYMPCCQCDDAPCLTACPTGAMQKRADGIVYIEESLCTGCRACWSACPWRVPQFDAQRQKMRKCDLCRHRIDAGLKPACVTGCTMSALQLMITDA